MDYIFVFERYETEDAYDKFYNFSQNFIIKKLKTKINQGKL